MTKLPLKPATKTVKGMSTAKVKESAVSIVNKEIGRQLSPAGKQAALDIGVLLVKVLDAYQVYYHEVGNMTIDLATVKNHFAAEVWAKLNNNQRLVLEAAVVAQAKGTQAAIDRHMKYLLENKRGVDTMGPNGQAAVEARLLQLQGIGEEGAP
jgi:hypothetical protein